MHQSSESGIRVNAEDSLHKRFGGLPRFKTTHAHGNWAPVRDLRGIGYLKRFYGYFGGVKNTISPWRQTLHNIPIPRAEEKGRTIRKRRENMRGEIKSFCMRRDFGDKL